jgi:hypothetical protein
MRGATTHKEQQREKRNINGAMLEATSKEHEKVN